MTSRHEPTDKGGTWQKFGRNTAASLATFALDLAILWSLVELLGLPRVLAAAIAFIIPLVLFYFIQREWVFRDERRSVGKGLAVFAMTVGASFLAMLAVFWALLQFTALHYLVARIAASLVYGLLLFFLNGRFNFRKL